MIWGLGPNGADGQKIADSCVAGQQQLENGSAFWFWCAIFFVLCMAVGIAVTTYFVVRNSRKDLTSCRNQVADEDNYIDAQERRINLSQRIPCSTTA